MQVLAYGVDSADGKFHQMEVTRRKVGENDVELEIIYSGICHSDIHQARNEWMNSIYPMVPGHEILGRVIAVGDKKGDLGGIGCFVDSCKECKHCKSHEEQFCVKGCAFTYNGYEMDKKTPTYGVKVSETFTKMEGVAPLLCAGITTYSPIRAHQSKVGPGKNVGVVGLGGLGHMAVKFAVSMGANVTVFSTSASKEADARKLGAQGFVLSNNADAMKATTGTFDFILDTVSAKHELAPYINALSPHGVLAIVGVPPEPYIIHPFGLIMGNKTVCGMFCPIYDGLGSVIGGIKETQEMIDYCAKHNIVSEVEVINMSQVEEAYERTVKADVRYRFVIDMKTFKKN